MYTCAKTFFFPRRGRSKYLGAIEIYRCYEYNDDRAFNIISNAYCILIYVPVIRIHIKQFIINIKDIIKVFL